MVYDSTFNGLLSAAAYCFRHNLQPLALVSGLSPQLPLEAVSIPCEKNIRNLFYRHLASVLGRISGERVLDTVYRAFLSESEGIETRILQYLALCLKLRQDPSARLFEPEAAAVVAAAAKVSGQAHQYLGLLRFRSIGPAFYLADFTPDYHVLPLILPHFADRLADQNFAIRDLRRRVAALHQAGGKTSLHVLCDTIMPADYSELLPVSDRYADLWTLYLQRLSIPDRFNPRLQQANLPKKYWRYLTEEPAGEKRQGDLC